MTDIDLDGRTPGMCTSTLSRNGHRFDCVMDELDCSVHAADDVDGDFVTWTD